MLLGQPQVLYKTPDGRYKFVTEGEEYNGTFEELLTQY